MAAIPQQHMLLWPSQASFASASCRRFGSSFCFSGQGISSLGLDSYVSGQVRRSRKFCTRSGNGSIAPVSCTIAEELPPAAAQKASSLEALQQQQEYGGRVFNFAAGPAILPSNVVKKAQSELFNWRGSGMSIMEMSHRGKEFLSVIQKAESDLRDLLKIPESYDVLFLQGGATTQFSAIPLNLCSPDDVADFIVTGSWGDKAFKEAQKYCQAKVVWTGKAEKFTSIPNQSELKLTNGAKYLHICANETIHGVEYKDYPSTGEGTLLIADMSSNFCSKPVDVSKFGLIYAGAQKNIGPAGVTIVIVRKDLIGKAQPSTPVMMDYKIHSENRSLFNTPPCFAIYVCGLVFEHLLSQGGLEAIERNNIEKAQLLYDTIDASEGFYTCPLEKHVRSLMNVPFTMATPEMEAEFIKEASAQGMVQLKGHRSVGGIRASIYNAMPRAGVEKLVAHMKAFQARHNTFSFSQ